MEDVTYLTHDDWNNAVYDFKPLGLDDDTVSAFLDAVSYTHLAPASSAERRPEARDSMFGDHLSGIYEKAFDPAISWEERLLRARELGFDYVEISIDEKEMCIRDRSWPSAWRARRPSPGSPEA